MSWLRDLTGAAPTAPPAAQAAPTATDGPPKVADPVIPGRMVAQKSANKPFLSYKAYRDEQAAAHDAWLQRKQERDAKLAKGEKVGPPEKDPTAEEEVGVLGLLKFILYLVLFAALAGKFFTGSFTWEYEGKWTQLKTFWPTDQRLFTESLLAQYDGSAEAKPLYLAIDGDVYDVSSNRATYGPGGSYHTMAGVDAARSFATGCFATHRTHDLRGLSEKELKSIDHWKKFFEDHKSYHKVGRVVHPPIDPSSPIPEHCDPKKRDAAKEKEKVKPEAVHTEATEKTHTGRGNDEL
ncbi:hypothetical protein PLICRDRAFT_34941 [Plicaturopsis crispa FD-325 SS-3]|nr:hypothetical protein PLICRDRAFT_34941 [Plicaturopsis crispa FD-325 SS-3]